MNLRCERKHFYDSEFQATVAAARAEANWGKAMKVYPCGRHYHISSKRKADRNKYPSRTWCDACNCKLRPGRYKRHIELPGHLRRVERKEKELES